MCVKENYKSEVLLICVFIALLWGAGNMVSVVCVVGVVSEVSVVQN